MVEPIRLFGLAGHLCHESRLLLPWTRKGLQGRSHFQVPLFLLPFNVAHSESLGATSVRALRQPGKHDGLEEAELVCCQEVSHLRGLCSGQL